jgi:hypothetical protein
MRSSIVGSQSWSNRQALCCKSRDPGRCHQPTIQPKNSLVLHDFRVLGNPHRRRAKWGYGVTRTGPSQLIGLVTKNALRVTWLKICLIGQVSFDPDRLNTAYPGNFSVAWSSN